VQESDDKYLALFNLGEDKVTPIEVKREELGFGQSVKIRDLWQQEDPGSFINKISLQIEPHGSRLFRITR
jgi:hypothetical protein